MNSGEELIANTLRDAPSKQDEFSGGAHSRIANTLAQIIEREPGGSIALLGEWGGGKSTVIEILIDKLKTAKSERQYEVFLFDVWSHQGDRIRRAFLEELIHELCEQRKVLKKKDYDGDLNLLRGEVIDTKEVVTHLSGFGYFLTILTIYCLPLGFLNVSPFAWGETVDIPLIGSIAAAFLGGFLLFLPVLAVILIWLFSGKSLSSLLSVLINKPDTIGSTTVIRTTGPTTVEMNKTFDKIVSQANGVGRRLLMVIDNLDRMPPKDALDAWAAMRNFFAKGDSGPRAESLDNVWAIFSLSDTSLADVLAGVVGSDAVKRADDRSVQETLSKTFDLTFRIPFPVVSDRQPFLEKALEKALGYSIAPDQLQDIFRLLEIYHANKGRAPTPRHIKMFASSFAIATAEWKKHGVDLLVIAASVLWRDEISTKTTTELAAGNLLPERAVRILSNLRWKRDIAALHFGVLPSKVVHVVFGPEVRVNLENGELTKLAELAQSEGFGFLLEEVVEQHARSWSESDPVLFASIAAYIQRLSEDGIQIPVMIWTTLSQNVSNLRDWLEFSDDVPTGLGAIVTNTHKSSGASVTKDLLASISPDDFTRKDPDGNDRIVVTAGNWVDTVQAIVEAAKKNIGEVKSLELLSVTAVPGPASLTVDIYAEAADRNAVDIKNSRPAVGWVKIAEFLTEVVTNRQFGERQYKALQFVPSSSASVDFSPLKAATVQRLSANEEVSPEERTALILALHRLGTNPELIGRIPELDKLSADGTLLRYLDQDGSIEDKPTDKTVIIITAILASQESANPPIPNTDHPLHQKTVEGQSRYKNFLANISADTQSASFFVQPALSYLGLEGLVGRAKGGSPSAGAAKSILEWLNENGALERLPIPWILENIGDIEQVLGQAGTKKFIKFFDGWEEHVRELLSKQVDSDKPSFIYSPKMLRMSGKLGTDVGRILMKDASTRIRAQSKDQWVSELEELGSSLDYLCELVDIGSSPKLGPTLTEALLDHSRKLADGQIAINAVPNDWSYLTKTMNASNRNVFAKALIRMLATKDVTTDLLLWFGRNYKGAIFATPSALKDVESQVLEGLITPLVNCANEEAKAILQGAGPMIRELLPRAGTQQQRYFEESLESVVSADEGWADFAKECGVIL